MLSSSGHHSSKLRDLWSHAAPHALAPDVIEYGVQQPLRLPRCAFAAETCGGAMIITKSTRNAVEGLGCKLGDRLQVIWVTGAPALVLAGVHAAPEGAVA